MVLRELVVTGIFCFGAGCSDHTAVESRRSAEPSRDADAKVSQETYSEIIGHVCREEGKAIGLFGSDTITVSSTSYWTSSGLYVKPGDRVDMQASGEWTIWAGQTAAFGPEGHPQLSMHEGCRKGSLVAKIGLTSESKPICIGKAGTFSASESGIVYLAMNDNASPTYHQGAVTVTIKSDADRAPVVSFEQAATYPYCQVSSGWVEIMSAEHVTLTVPVDLADLYQDKIVDTLEFFDAAYEHMSRLSGGGVPFDGERVRFYPDFGLSTGGWIKTGNPVLLDPRHLNAVYPSKSALLATGDEAYSSFDFLRALGVAFSRYRGSNYQVNEASAEAFGGHFASYAMEQMGRFDMPRSPCLEKDRHQQTGSFNAFVEDSWLQLCLLTELQNAEGWGLFTRFWSELPERADWENFLPASATAAEKWKFLAVSLAPADLPPVVVSESPGQNSASSLFTSFHIPLE